MLELKPHQKKIVETIPNKFCCWARPRTGKTPTAIRLACARVKTCLVIIPKHIKEQWEEEIKRWNNTDCQFILITKERFRIDSIAGVKNKGKRKTLIFSDKIPKADAVIIDEVHRQASNYSNKFYKTVQDYIDRHEIKHVWLLSGTPWNKNPWSVYSYGKLIGKNWDWMQWRGRYFTHIAYGARSFWKPNEKMFPELAILLQRIGVTVRLEDVADIGEDYEETEYFDLNADQKRHIKAVADTTPMARYVKYHQLESGVLKSDGYLEELSFECDKDKRIIELAEDEDKLIIVCRYLAQIEKYRKILTKLGKTVYVIQGEMSEPLEIIRQKAEESRKCIVLIQAEKSDGYSLASFNIMVFASMSYSFISYDQMKNRMKAMDKSKGCSYIYLLSRGKTIDRGVYDSVKRGEDFSDKVFSL